MYWENYIGSGIGERSMDKIDEAMGMFGLHQMGMV